MDRPAQQTDPSPLLNGADRALLPISTLLSCRLSFRGYPHHWCSEAGSVGVVVESLNDTKALQHYGGLVIDGKGRATEFMPDFIAVPEPSCPARHSATEV